jgi:adenosylhomocysteine nucleosidase
VATKVVYYDLRKEMPSRTHHRGEGREAPAKIGHAVNRFFTEHGQTAEITPADGEPFRVLTGPIGSGEAVIADRDAEIRRYLTSFNDKVLAVDMESGGLTQFCHEHAGHPEGWVIVRGISDHATSEKNDEHHHRAAWHAAIVLRALIPYLLDDL